MEPAVEGDGDRPLLVMISGAPGSGKTTLARHLGDELRLPVVSRDLIKTGMHVTVRSEDPAEILRFAAPVWRPNSLREVGESRYRTFRTVLDELASSASTSGRA